MNFKAVEADTTHFHGSEFKPRLHTQTHALLGLSNVKVSIRVLCSERVVLHTGKALRHSSITVGFGRHEGSDNCFVIDFDLRFQRRASHSIGALFSWEVL